MAANWARLCRRPQELQLAATLANGQCFGWARLGAEVGCFLASLAKVLTLITWSGVRTCPQWVGVLGDGLVALREERDEVQCRWVQAPAAGGMELAPLLHDYLHLQVELESLYAAWGSANVVAKELGPKLPGLRLLRQPPVECLVSFICSSNNNIPRITQMLARLRQKYGTPVATYQDMQFFTFPTLDCLASLPENELRALGFGYRAGYVVKTATKVLELGGEPWLLRLRQEPYLQVRQALLQLDGVGPKVADCVALFCLDKHDAVPIDTHVTNFTIRYFDPSLRAKTLTAKVYEQVGDLLRLKLGTRAGWLATLLKLCRILL